MDSTTTYQARFTRDSGKITQKNNDTKDDKDKEQNKEEDKKE